MRPPPVVAATLSAVGPGVRAGLWTSRPTGTGGVVRVVDVEEDAAEAGSPTPVVGVEVGASFCSGWPGGGVWPGVAPDGWSPGRAAVVGSWDRGCAGAGAAGAAGEVATCGVVSLTRSRSASLDPTMVPTTVEATSNIAAITTRRAFEGRRSGVENPTGLPGSLANRSGSGRSVSDPLGPCSGMSVRSGSSSTRLRADHSVEDGADNGSAGDAASDENWVTAAASGVVMAGIAGGSESARDAVGSVALDGCGCVASASLRLRAASPARAAETSRSNDGASGFSARASASAACASSALPAASCDTASRRYCSARFRVSPVELCCGRIPGAGGFELLRFTCLGHGEPGCKSRALQLRCRTAGEQLLAILAEEHP